DARDLRPADLTGSGPSSDFPFTISCSKSRCEDNANEAFTTCALWCGVTGLGAALLTRGLAFSGLGFAICVGACAIQRMVDRDDCLKRGGGCLSGYQCCHGQCVPECSGDQFVDPLTCECRQPCPHGMYFDKRTNECRCGEESCRGGHACCNNKCID